MGRDSEILLVKFSFKFQISEIWDASILSFVENNLCISVGMNLKKYPEMNPSKLPKLPGRHLEWKQCWHCIETVHSRYHFDELQLVYSSMSAEKWWNIYNTVHHCFQCDLFWFTLLTLTSLTCLVWLHFYLAAWNDAFNIDWWVFHRESVEIWIMT